ncbi:MAG: hypothetical protein ACQEQB_05185 [Bacteroidota bacterium]
MEKKLEKILRLIAAGDQDVILDEKERIKQLEVLVKYEMVSVENKKLFLTKKGEIAIITGMDVFLNEFPLKETPRSCSKMQHYLKNWDRKRKISFMVWILLLLIGIMLRHSVT